MTALIDPKKYTKTIDLLRSFFLSKGFLEVHTQNRLSILAACEDPETVATYEYEGEVWPLPQTGQMWLEYELLKNPEVPGFFCLSTSYRAEREWVRKDPINKGRHEVIFPMFEFEMQGGIEELKEMEFELCEHLGIPFSRGKAKTYAEWCKHFDELELDNTKEATIWDGMITDFPEFTSPFWNMARNEGDTSIGTNSIPAKPHKTSKKIDVILDQIETIGSAERSCDKDQMRETFYTISNGEYAELLFKLFGKERVEKELEEFLEFDFFPRSGGGIGVQRLMKALDKKGILD